MGKFGQDLFGAWVLKCNPERWDIVAFLREGNKVVDGWSVQDNVRTHNMRVGDPVMFWVSGSGTTIAAGVWGIGKVSGRAAPGTPDKYWLSRPGSIYAPIDLVVDRCLLTRAAVKQNPILETSELVQVPKMSNPVMLTAIEWSELQRVL